MEAKRKQRLQRQPKRRTYSGPQLGLITLNTAHPTDHADTDVDNSDDHPQGTVPSNGHGSLPMDADKHGRRHQKHVTRLFRFSRHMQSAIADLKLPRRKKPDGNKYIQRPRSKSAGQICRNCRTDQADWDSGNYSSSEGLGPGALG